MRLKSKLFLFTSIILVSCIDPVAPEYDILNGQIYVDGFASTAPGASYVIIGKSNTDFGLFRSIFEEGARVSFENSSTKEVVELIEQEDVYVPPPDFAVSVGETWELNVVLADGRELKSEPETVIAPVEISDISTVYDPELKYSDAYGIFVPGHSVSITFDDPANEDNYYFWRFKSYENLSVCKYCANGKLRNGVCVDDPLAYSYLCDVDCWRIRYNENIQIFADELTNGKTVRDLPVAEVLLYTNENILVSIEQSALTSKAYAYYKTLKDLVDNNAGISAPPPAALVGNMFNATDDEEFILGRFTATATSTFPVFIDRSDILDRVLETEPFFRTEAGLGQVVITAPCVEGRYRTTIRPEDWID